MIKNEKQYQVTKSRLKEFTEALQQLREESGTDPLLHEIQIDAINSKIADFNREMEEYQSLKKGEIFAISINSLNDIHEVLIKARIAKGWTHADLADRLGLKEQQIQRYEATDYEAASISRVNEVLMALGLNISPIKVEIRPPQFNIPAGIVIDMVYEKLQQKGTLLAVC